MCGRFTLTVPSYEILAETLGLAVSPAIAALYRPRYNIAPSDATLLLRAGPRDPGRVGAASGETGARVRTVTSASWGLVPAWSKTLGQVGRPINARVETLREKPAFHDALQRRRGVAVADGFYEWQREGTARHPVWIHPRAGELCLMAALWESWRDPASGQRLESFAIITTAASEEMAWLHDRMPLLIPPSSVDAWLGVRPAPAEELRSLLRPPASGQLAFLPVGDRANSVKNDDPSCLEPRALYAEGAPAPAPKARPPKRVRAAVPGQLSLEAALRANTGSGRS